MEGCQWDSRISPTHNKAQKYRMPALVKHSALPLASAVPSFAPGEKGRGM